MKPSVGDVVHYVSYGTPGGEYTSQCRAAIVTEVVESGFGTLAGLCVLNPTGQFFNRAIEQDERGKRGGTWHWPERVESAHALSAGGKVDVAVVEEVRARLAAQPQEARR